MKTSKTTRLLAVVLSALMIFTALPVTVFAAEGALAKGDKIEGTDFFVTSVKNYAIAPDITEKVVMTNNDEHSSQTVANVMEINTNNGNAKIVAGYGNLNPTSKGWTLATTTNQAHLYEKSYNENVVGGVNASWFNITTGEPSGNFVMRGTVHHTSDSVSYIAAFSDGSVNIFRGSVSLTDAEIEQSAIVGSSVKIVEAIDGYGSPLVWDGKATDTQTNSGFYPRTAVGVKADGTVVLFQADGAMAPRSVGYTTSEEAAFMISLGCVKAIALDEGGSSTYLSQREGEDDLTMRNTAAGGQERVISGTILVVSTVKADNTFDHVNITPDNEIYTPGSKITFEATGIDFSGALADEIPEGSVWKIDDETMGTLENSVFDGNNSSVTFVAGDKTGDFVVSLVGSDGTVYGSASASIQNPDRLYFGASEISLLYGESSDLGLTALYNGFNVNLNPDDIEWDIYTTNYAYKVVENPVIENIDNYFYTPSNVSFNNEGSVVVPSALTGNTTDETINENAVYFKAVYDNDFSAKQYFELVEDPSEDEIANYYCPYFINAVESSFNTDLYAYYTIDTENSKKVNALETDEFNGAGTFTGNLFTVTSNKQYSGEPCVSAYFSGLSTDSPVKIIIGKLPVNVIDGGDEDGLDYNKLTTTYFQNELATVASDKEIVIGHYNSPTDDRHGLVSAKVVSDTEDEYADIIRFGHNAIRIDYDWSNLTGTDGACIGLAQPLYLDGTPTAFGVWVYIPDDNTPVPWLRSWVETSTDWDGDPATADSATWTRGECNFSNEDTDTYNNGGKISKAEDVVVNLKAGWNYLQCDLTKYTGCHIRVNSGMMFRAMAGANTNPCFAAYTTAGNAVAKSQRKGWILMDNMSIIYGYNNVDVLAPELSQLSIRNNDGTFTEIEDGATYTQNQFNFFAAYNDHEDTDDNATGVESAYFYFDGIYQGVGTQDILGSSLNNQIFSNGQHSITFYLKDGYGNVSRETRYFTVAGTENTSSKFYDMTSLQLDIPEEPRVGNVWELDLISNLPTDLQSFDVDFKITSGFSVKEVVFADNIDGEYIFNAEKGKLNVKCEKIDENSVDVNEIAKIYIDIPQNVPQGATIGVQVEKGAYGSYHYTIDNYSLQKNLIYVTRFSTPMTYHSIQAAYILSADAITVGHPAKAVVTTTGEFDSSVSDINVYAGTGDEYFIVGITDENGEVDISSLNTQVDNYTLFAADENNDFYSYSISVSCDSAIGNEDGTPYNILTNAVEDAATERNITWMSNPDFAAEKAQIIYSESEDFADSITFDGTCTSVAYSFEQVSNLVNAVYITGLSPETKYYYKVGDGSIWSDVMSFTTAKETLDTTKFYVIADIQEDAAIEGMKKISAQIANDYFDFGVQLGDATDNPTVYAEWNTTAELFALDGINDTEVVHVIGNHEDNDGGTNGRTAKKVYNIDANTDGLWYSFERGNVYVAVLNYTLNRSYLADFCDWLKKDAAESNCQWKVLLSHVPVYYTNEGGGEIYLPELSEGIEAAGIDFAFAGNDHSYARTAPVKTTYDDNGIRTTEEVENGTYYCIAGCTGGKNYTLVNDPSFHFAKTAQADTDFSCVYMTVEADAYSITATAYDITPSGDLLVLDSYSKAIAPCDKHEFVYIEEQNVLYCSVCNTKIDCVAEKVSGWYKDAATGEQVYLLDGKPADYLCDYDNAEHSYVYDPSDDSLFCDNANCTFNTKASEEIFSGWATDISGNGDYYFIGGNVSKGYVYDVDAPRYFDENGLAFSGEKTICGEKCVFEKGAFVADDNILLAGYIGEENLTDVEFVLYRNGVLDIEGTGAPAKFDSYNSSYPTVPWNAVKYRENVKTVNFGKDITSVSKGLFRSFTNLENIVFEEGSLVERFGIQTLYYDSPMKQLVLPEGVERIDAEAFGYRTSLEKLYVPASVTQIAPDAFANGKTGSGKVLDTITLCVVKDSYAHKYAEKYGIPYEFATVECAENGHTGGKATCNELAVCVNCGTEYGELDLTAHIGGTSTCIKAAVCDICGKEYGEIDLSAHTGGTATCTKAAVCDICGKEYGEINSYAHTLKVLEAKEATYDENGLTTGVICSECGAILVAQEETPKLERVTKDVDGDGEVTVVDARQALRFAIGLDTADVDPVAFSQADLDNDGAVTVEEARLILRTAVKLDD